MAFSSPFTLRCCGVLLLSLAGGLSACTLAPLSTLSAEHSRAKWQQGAEVARRPLIVVPGIQGSRLFEGTTGQQVWGSFAGNYANPGDPDGMRLLALPMQVGVPLSQLRDEVIPEGLMRRFRFNLLRLLPLSINGYDGLIKNLEAEGYRFEPPGTTLDSTPFYNAFIFTYDWRRDNVENAQRLYHFIREKRALLQQQAAYRGKVPDQDLRFDLLTHSMGGLVARYMLRYGDANLPEEGDTLPEVTWTGARYVHDVLITAPPNAGSLRPFRALVEGRKYLPGVARFESAVLGTLPALYQLLPRPGGGQVLLAEDTARTAVDLFDPELWERMGWGLADPGQVRVLRILLPDIPTATARRRIALDHQRKSLNRARRFADALDAPARLPVDLTLHLIAGNAEPTDAEVIWYRETRRLLTISKQQGDSRVLRSSTKLPVYPAHSFRYSTTFLAGHHMGLTRDPLLARRLRGWLYTDR